MSVRIRALAFDLDGTLYPDSALRLRAWPLVFRHPALGLAFAAWRKESRRHSSQYRYPAITAEAIIPDGTQAQNTAVSDTSRFDAGPGSPAGRTYRLMQIRSVALRLGIAEKRADALLEHLYYRRMIDFFARIRPSPYVVEALTRFEQLGLPMGLLSDLPPWRKLELMGLTRFFRVILCSEDSGHLKPHPAGLLATAQALGFSPHEMLYVGNNPRYDLVGAHAAGMAAAIVSRRPVPGADFSFYDWRELIAFVEAHSGGQGTPPTRTSVGSSPSIV